MARIIDSRSPARAAAGRASKAAGAGFEFWVELQHKEAVRRGLLACVEKSEPHCRIVHGRVSYTSASVADYFGTIAAAARAADKFSGRPHLAVLGGLSFAAEAKSTADERLARAAVQPKQAQHLDAVARAGGLALLLCEFRSAAPVRCAVPWAEVPWVKLRTADSVGLADIRQWAVAPGENYLSKFLTAPPP